MNHLGHFALTVGLKPALAAAGGRVVSVSSGGHLASPVVFDDIHFKDRDYATLAAYGQSKTANVLLAVGIADRWRALGVTANAVRPGTVATGLMRHTGMEQATRFAGGPPGAPGTLWKTPHQGAATPVLAAASPLVDGVSGRYFDDCQEAPVIDPTAGETAGVAGWALDPDQAARLWSESTRLLADQTADRLV